MLSSHDCIMGAAVFCNLRLLLIGISLLPFSTVFQNSLFYRPGEDVHIRVVPLYLQMLPIKNTKVEVTVKVYLINSVSIYKSYAVFYATCESTKIYRII